MTDVIDDIEQIYIEIIRIPQLIQANPADGTTNKLAAGISITSAPFATPVSVGNRIVVVVSQWHDTPEPIQPIITDNKGNIYQIDVYQSNGARTNVTIASTVVTNGGAGLTITATATAGDPSWDLAAYEISNATTLVGINSNAGSSNQADSGAVISPNIAYYVAATAYQGSTTTITPDDPSWTQDNENEDYNYATLNSCHIIGSGSHRLTWTFGVPPYWTGWTAAIAAYAHI